MEFFMAIALLCQVATGNEIRWKSESEQASCHKYYAKCFRESKAKFRNDTQVLTHCIENR